MKYVVLLTLLVYTLSGCGSRPGRSSSSADGQNQGNRVQVQQTSPQPRSNLSNNEIASHLEQLAARIPNVESAQVVLFGNTAVVGINVNPKLDRAQVGTTKFSVAEALLKDPYGANAIVTADMDLGERIRRIRDEVKNGRPMSGFADEMGRIVGRIMPQLPRDVNTGTNGPNPIDNNAANQNGGQL